MPTPRKRDLVFDELARLDSPDLTQLTNPGRVAKAKKLITSVMVGTPTEQLAQEIRRRVQVYRTMWPRATVTSTAIANHWGRLAGDEKPNAERARMERELQDQNLPPAYREYLAKQMGLLTP